MDVPAQHAPKPVTSLPLPETPKTAAERVSDLIEDGSLYPSHYKALKNRAISDEVILERGYATWKGPHAALEAEKGWGKGQRDPKRYPALAYPIYQLGGETPHTYVYRPDQPRKNKDGKAVKYEWCKGVRPVIDVLPKYKEALADPAKPLWLSPEGSLKADALASIDVVSAAINGVFGWRAKNDMGASLILPDFEGIVTKGRKGHCHINFV